VGKIFKIWGSKFDHYPENVGNGWWNGVLKIELIDVIWNKQDTNTIKFSEIKDIVVEKVTSNLEVGWLNERFVGLVLATLENKENVDKFLKMKNVNKLKKNEIIELLSEPLVLWIIESWNFKEDVDVLDVKKVVDDLNKVVFIDNENRDRDLYGLFEIETYVETVIYLMKNNKKWYNRFLNWGYKEYYWFNKFLPENISWILDNIQFDTLAWLTDFFAKNDLFGSKSYKENIKALQDNPTFKINDWNFLKLFQNKGFIKLCLSKSDILRTFDFSEKNINFMINNEGDESIRDDCRYKLALQLFKDINYDTTLFQQKYKDISNNEIIVDNGWFNLWWVNSSELIWKLTHINWIPIDVLEYRLKPRSDQKLNNKERFKMNTKFSGWFFDYSNDWFLWKDEKFKDVLIKDNNYVQEHGFTHQDIANKLQDVVEKFTNCKNEDREIEIGGVTYKNITEHGSWRQHSPFKHLNIKEIKNSVCSNRTYCWDEIKIRNLKTWQEIFMGDGQHTMIREYWFYQWEGTPYRVGPKQLIKMFDMKVENI